MRFAIRDSRFAGRAEPACDQTSHLHAFDLPAHRIDDHDRGGRATHTDASKEVHWGDPSPGATAWATEAGLPISTDPQAPLDDLEPLREAKERSPVSVVTIEFPALRSPGRAVQSAPDHELAPRLELARRSETQAHWFARDIRALAQWLGHDVLALAGPALATRRELFDFIVEELAAREREDARRIRPVRVALQNQRDDLLAFAGVLDAKLADIAHAYAIAERLVREACVLHRLPTPSPAYWQGWSRLRAQVAGKFRALFEAVSRAMADTPRSSSLVENLNSRLRSYFALRRHLGGSYLDLLRFFLNHRRFVRSRHAERRGKSPRELMTGQSHPHWLTLLGLGTLHPRRV